jgi:hypothetical protein
VIGKVSRLGLLKPQKASSKIKRINRRSKKARLLHYEENGMGDAARLPQQVFENPKRLLQLKTGDCRFPGEGWGLELLFCAAPAAVGHPYCPEHCSIAYTPSRRYY